LQQKKDEEGIQEVATQEPTPLEAAARTPELQSEDNLGVNVILDTQQSGDEQVQTPYSGDTEILEEELQFEEDIQSQQQKDKEDTVTQEPVSPIAMKVAAEESLKDVAVTQEPATLQLHTEGIQFQHQKAKEDTVTQEPVSPKAIKVAAEESLKDVAVTQEPATTQPQQQRDKEDTVTQEPVSPRAIEVATEEDIIPQEPVLPPPRDVIELGSD
jgi:hypothetical protein